MKNVRREWAATLREARLTSSSGLVAKRGQTRASGRACGDYDGYEATWHTTLNCRARDAVLPVQQAESVPTSRAPISLDKRGSSEAFGARWHTPGYTAGLGRSESCATRWEFVCLWELSNLRVWREGVGVNPRRAKVALLQ